MCIRDRLSTYHLESGEEKLNRMVNIWHQYQCMVTFNMSRSAKRCIRDSPCAGR